MRRGLSFDEDSGLGREDVKPDGCIDLGSPAVDATGGVVGGVAQHPNIESDRPSPKISSWSVLEERNGVSSVFDAKMKSAKNRRRRVPFFRLGTTMDEDSGLAFDDHIATTAHKENVDCVVSASTHKTTILDRADAEDVIGDFSRPHCLPTVNGKHSDLQCISPETVCYPYPCLVY